MLATNNGTNKNSHTIQTTWVICIIATLTHWDIIELFQFTVIIVGVSTGSNASGSTDHGAMTVNVIVNAIQLDVVRDIAVDMLRYWTEGARTRSLLLLFHRCGVRPQGRRIDRVGRLMMGGGSELLLLLMMVIVVEVRMER